MGVCAGDPNWRAQPTPSQREERRVKSYGRQDPSILQQGGILITKNEDQPGAEGEWAGMGQREIEGIAKVQEQTQVGGPARSKITRNSGPHFFSY